MERTHSSGEIWGAFQFGLDGPKAWSAGSVEGLGEVFEEQVPVLVLFDTFFLQFSEDKDHVNSTSFLSETAMTFRDTLSTR